MNDIVVRIYDLMAKAGISKTVLAEKINVSRNTIQNWKKLNSIPTLAVIERICGVFNITVEQFFSGIGKAESEKGELEFIDAWRVMGDKEKTIIQGVIETFKELRRV